MTEDIYPTETQRKVRMIDNFIRTIDSLGWECEVYIERGGCFDRITNGLMLVIKDDDGFIYGGHNFIYIK